MTPIDEVLDGLRLQSTVFSRMTLAGDWGFAKDQLSGAPFHLLLSGRACLQMEGEDAQTLEGGDIAILPRGSRHHLLAFPGVTPVPWRNVIHHMGWTHWSPGMRFKSVDFRYGSGEPTTTLISGVFAFGDRQQNPLLAALPETLVVRTDESSASARAIVALTSLLDAELLSGKPGAESVAARLADILFIQVVRHHLSSFAESQPGWLRAIADPEIAPAISMMHASPDQAWSVALLAQQLGMSRSRFAARFQEVVGQAPLEYLTHWRMHQAASRLASGKIPLSTLAKSVGYKSDVAFSKAFKRWAGVSPLEYRRSRSLTSSNMEERPAIGFDGESRSQDDQH